MRLRPIIHGRDHEHGGADVTRIVYEDVGDSGGGGGGGGGGIMFDTDPQVGDWLVIQTSGAEPYSGGAIGVANGITLYASGAGGIDILSEAGVQIGANLQSLSIGISDGDGTGGQIRIANNSSGVTGRPDLSGIEIIDSGSTGAIKIIQDGGGDVIIEQNTAGALELALNANAPMHLYNNGSSGAALIEIKNTGNGGITISDLGDGGVNITGSFGGVTITMNDSSYLTLVGLPTSSPGGTGRVWNSGGTLKIT